MKLTEAQVLEAVAKACSPRSLYIGDVIARSHGRFVLDGGKGHPPAVGLILRRLRALENSGLLECVGGPDGYYGFEWRITEAGRSALAGQVSLPASGRQG